MTRADGTRATEGRPSMYTEELADKFCELLSTGSSLRSACQEEGMPAPVTIFQWIRKHEEFAKQYARACEERTEAMSEDILDISDDGSNDWMEKRFGDTEAWVTNGEALQRSRLRVDTRKWLMSKMKPKKYGDKLDLTAESTVTHKFEELDDEQLDQAIKARQNRLS